MTNDCGPGFNQMIPQFSLANTFYLFFNKVEIDLTRHQLVFSLILAILLESGSLCVSTKENHNRTGDE